MTEIGNKLLTVLNDVQQKSEISKGLLEDLNGTKLREQSLTATIK